MSKAIASENIAELTLKSILLAIILTVVLALSNAYLALKLGLLTSASIPAAIISMGILRFFKKSTILENNAVQTAASAGEAVAGGIVYTIPALIIIQYWQHFDYFTNFFIAASGGVLGVLFSIPLRRILVNDDRLAFPEGKAIAEVLKTSADKNGVKDIFLGGAIGAFLELLQTGFKVIASNWSFWFSSQKSLFGFGLGFSPTMIGAGFLVGYEMALSIFIGAVIAWFMAVPILSQFYPELINQHEPAEAVTLLWNAKLRYLGIGAMLFAGIFTFIKLIKPLVNSIRTSLISFNAARFKKKSFPRTDKDIPFPFILLLGSVVLVCLYFFFQSIFPLKEVGLEGQVGTFVSLGLVIYVLVIGFLFSVITAYFSGMVGVTASPGSSVVIAGMLLAAWILLTIINHYLPLPLTVSQLKSAEAITIIIGSVVTGIAAIANDNTQDLKVGQLVGATPWRQQLMLLIGVIVSALVIPPVMQILFDVYGIAGIMPHEGMDVSQSLPAPTAALMAAITEAVFQNTLPWSMMFIGAAIILLIIVANHIFKFERHLKLSILGVAIGMYLPLSSSLPLFLGGMLAFIVHSKLNKSKALASSVKEERKQRGTLIACGLVAGSALMDVCLAIPFSMMHSPDALNLVGPGWQPYALISALVSTLGLALWIRYRVTAK